MVNFSPKISIITVCKDSEKTIEKSIQSVISQDYPNIEYIIIDGKSKDNTLPIIRKYLGQINVLISDKDNGIYDAINKGIKHANGDLIGILNSDDQYFPRTLSTVAKKYRSDTIISGYCIVSNGSSIQLSSRSGKRFQKKKPLNKLKYRMAIDHPAMFVPSECYSQLGLYDIKFSISSDYKWTANAWKSGVHFDIIDKPLVLFSRGGASDNNWITSSKENRLIQAELGLLSSLQANVYFVFRILNFIKTFVIRALSSSN